MAQSFSREQLVALGLVLASATFAAWAGIIGGDVYAIIVTGVMTYSMGNFKGSANVRGRLHRAEGLAETNAMMLAELLRAHGRTPPAGAQDYSPDT